VLVVRHPPGPGHPSLRAFLASHKFYAKGIHNDKIQLTVKFGQSFVDNIEDIQKTRLSPYSYSLNFIAMTIQFAGHRTADFKDIRITTSDWNVPTLSARQVLYAGFDVVALYHAYPHFPPPTIRVKPAPVQWSAPKRSKLVYAQPHERKARKAKTRQEWIWRIVLKVTEPRPIVG
jgi:hypothetical protein